MSKREEGLVWENENETAKEKDPKLTKYLTKGPRYHPPGTRATNVTNILDGASPANDN